MAHILVGDSISLGYGASVPSVKGYVPQLEAALGITFDKIAVSGSQSIDHIDAVFSRFPAPGSKSLVMLGTNDQDWYGNDAAKIGYAMDALRAYAISLTCDAYDTPSTPPYSSGVAFTGTWVGGLPCGGYGSSALGAKANVTIPGNTIMLCMVRQYNNTSTFTVKIDGVSKGSFSTGGDLRSMAGKSWGPMGLCFTGLGSGNHNCEIEVTSNTGHQVFFRRFASVQPHSSIRFINVPTGNGGYNYNGSDAGVVTFNAALDALAAELVGYGTDAAVIDSNSSLIPSTDMNDKVHPNDTGHSKILADAHLGITGEPLMFPSTFKRGIDGKIYFTTPGFPSIEWVTS